MITGLSAAVSTSTASSSTTTRIRPSLGNVDDLPGGGPFHLQLEDRLKVEPR
jgi:hypothetical protein